MRLPRDRSAGPRGAEPRPRLAGDHSRYVEHILQLLSPIVGREPLEAAVRGIHSPHAGIRGLAVEYLGQVLPAAVLERLRMIVAMDPAAVRP
jgi:hypothetical protein